MHGPTTERATQYPAELRNLYNDLTTLSTSMILTAGDFNGKVGRADEFETCIGKPAVIGMIMDKKLLSGAKTTTSICATLPSNTNKAT